MNTDGIFTLQVVKVPMRSYKQVFSLCPIGDLHHNSKLFDKKMFARNVKKWNEVENPLWLGMGDYGDIGSSGELETFRKLHSATVEEIYDMLCERAYELVDLLEFSRRGQWAGFIGGNHKSPISASKSVDDLLCEEFDAPYLGVMSMIRFDFCMPKKKPLQLFVLAHHGAGGGQTNGASVNKVEAMNNIAFAHIYLMGHDHKKFISETGFLYGNNSFAHVVSGSQYYGRTGSYPQAYKHNTPNWVVAGAMKPVPLGSIRFDIGFGNIGTGAKPKMAFDISGVTM